MTCLAVLATDTGLTARAWARSERTQCTARDLERQDCLLKKKPLELQLSSRKVAWSDGVWNKIDNLPFSGEGFVWEKIVLREIKKRAILQMWIWDLPAGEAQVQNLHWIVIEFRNHKMKVIAQEIVRKRHPKPRSDEKEPVSYLNDPMDPHGLKEAKGDRLKWTHGEKSGEF